MSTASVSWIDSALLRTTLAVVCSSTCPLYSSESKKQCAAVIDLIDSGASLQEVQTAFSKVPIFKRSDLARIPVRERTCVDQCDVVFYGATSGTTSAAPLLVPFAHVDDYFFDPTFGGLVFRPLVIYPPLLGSFGHSFVRQCRERNNPATPIFSDFRNLHNAALVARETSVDSIYATPTIAAAFAECCRAYIDPTTIRVVALGSETITSVQRTIIATAFPNAQIVNLYASAEIGQFILIPPTKNISDTADEFVPILGAVAALELVEGELVVTYGNNAAQPLVRYATGDMFESVGTTDDRRPVIRWMHRDGVDRIRVNGLEITVGTFDELLSKASPVPGAPRYQVQCVEQKNGKVRIEVYIEDAAENSAVYQQAATQLVSEYLLEQWILPSGKPFSYAVEQGLFVGPIVEFVRQLPPSLKARKLIVVQDND